MIDTVQHTNYAITRKKKIDKLIELMFRMDGVIV